MSGVGIAVIPQGDGTNRYRVSCPEHGLDRTVETPGHAANLEALHMRVEHGDDTDPISVDLTAAANVVAGIWEENIGRGIDALYVWKALTGITSQAEALDFADEIAAADPPITATIPPF